ncbi:hypothetical protein BDW72DRAFT_206426 [Aspergillus terricola var. indicus]
MPHTQHIDVPSSRPINDSALNRLLTLLAIAAFRNVRPFKGTVLMLTDRLRVKYGDYIDLSEAATMPFISENTSIPVPKIHCAFIHKGCSYIVMERIKGDMIGAGWVYRSEESKAKLLTQLKMVQEMRAIPPPEGTGVSSVDGGSLFDCRLPGPALRFEPFSSVQAFHRHLREGVGFNPELDSEYPSYWECNTACQVNPQNSCWINEIDKFLTPMPDELKMKQTRQKYFGDFENQGWAMDYQNFQAAPFPDISAGTVRHHHMSGSSSYNEAITNEINQ